MTQIHWLNDVSGDFSNAPNWSGGVVPGSSDDVTLGALGRTPYTVTLSATEQVASLQTAANATLDVSAGVVFQSDKGTGARASAGVIDDLGHLVIGGAFKNMGSVTIGGAAGPAYMELMTNITLSGGGYITMNDGEIYEIDDASELTNVDNRLDGNVAVVVRDLTNGGAGVIDMNGSNPNGLVQATSTLRNTGLIENTAPNTDLGISTVTLDQTGGGVLLAGDQTQINIVSHSYSSGVNVDLIGGTLASSGSGVIYLEDVELDGENTAVRVTGQVSTFETPLNGQSFNLLLAGEIVNSGVITNAPGRPHGHALDTSELEIQGGVTLTGGGEISLGAYGKLVGAGVGASLDNVDNTIAGVGYIGGPVITNGAAGVIDATGRGRLLAIDVETLTNEGLIEDTGAVQLLIENAFIANSGQIDAVGGGRLELSGTALIQTSEGVFTVGRAFLDNNAEVAGGTVDILRGGQLLAGGAANVSSIGSLIINDGRLEVAAVTLTITGAVSGTGLGVIAGGVLDFEGAFEERVQFLKGSGTLRLAHSQSYTGAVFHFSTNGQTALDLEDIGFVGGGEASYNGTAVKGVLTVNDGTHTAHISLVGDYLGDLFTAASDGHGGTVITAGAGQAAFVATAASLPSPHLLLAASASLGGHSRAGWSTHANVAANPLLTQHLFASRPALA